MAYTVQTWTETPGAVTAQVTAARLNHIEAGISTAQTTAEAAGGTSGSAPSGYNLYGLSEFTGATKGAQLRDAIAKFDASAFHGAVVIDTYNPTLDAGATPFSIPPGFVLRGMSGGQSEFGSNTMVTVRATGGNSVFATRPRGTNDSGCKGWQFKDIDFEGTSAINMWADNPMNASGSVWSYVTIDGCSFDGFHHLTDTPMLGVTWMGRTYLNNFASHALRLGGSDNHLFTDGGYVEQNGTSSYSTKATGAGVIRLGTCQKTLIGPIYNTGSPQCAFVLEGGQGGVQFLGTTAEGRESTSGGTLSCAGAAIRVSGGTARIDARWVGYAMHDPSATGRGDAGYIHVSGGAEVAITGVTFQRYTDVAESVPVVYATGTGTKVFIQNCLSGSNWSGAMRHTAASGAVITSNCTTAI